MPFSRRRLFAASAAILLGSGSPARSVPQRSMLDPYEPVGPLALAPGADPLCLADQGVPFLPMFANPDDAEDLDRLIFRQLALAAANAGDAHNVGTLAELWAALIFVRDRMAEQGRPAANVFVAESFARWIAERAGQPAPLHTQWTRWRGLPVYQSRRVPELSALIVASPERAGRLVAWESLVGIAVLPATVHRIQVV